MMATVEGPRCCHEQEYDTEDDEVLCDNCEEMIFILGDDAISADEQTTEKEEN